MRKWLVVFAALVVTGPAPAAEDSGDPADITRAQCRAAYEACTAACADRNPDSTAGRMSCKAACAGQRAGCEAMVGLEELKPWMKDQYDAARDFLDEFLGRDRQKDSGDEPESPDVREI